MTSRPVAVVLIVVGVAATLGGLYGQFFLTDDDGHHDGRDATFALESAVGSFELSATPDDDGVALQLSQAGQPVTSFDGLHDTDGPHVVIVGEQLDSYARQTPPDLSTPIPVTGSGTQRVILQADLAGGPDLLELGTTVDVEGAPQDPQNIADDDVWTDGSSTVRRQGFDFVLSEPWNGDDLYGGPALLTLIRAEDFAFTHAHADVVDGNRFSFSVDLPGLGDFLAAVEFEQDGEEVTALFRFSL